MSSLPPEEVTRLLQEWSRGDQSAFDQLTPLVYGELLRIAHRYLTKERADHTLQTTALVHEAYLRLVDQRNVNWQSRAHFFGIAARMMRRILVDYARKRRYAKRGGDAPRLSLQDVELVAEERVADLIALDDALANLASLDPRQSQVVELRVFGGMTIEETAEVLHLSQDMVKREWSTAKAFLAREISRKG